VRTKSAGGIILYVTAEYCQRVSSLRAGGTINEVTKTTATATPPVTWVDHIGLMVGPLVEIGSLRP
jgi:hypothetical protein